MINPSEEPACRVLSKRILLFAIANHCIAMTKYCGWDENSDPRRKLNNELEISENHVSSHSLVKFPECSNAADPEWQICTVAVTKANSEGPKVHRNSSKYTVYKRPD